MSMIFSLSLSLSFTQLSHPLALGLTLIFHTLMICITATVWAKLSWFSFILFIIFLGATLVLFIYIASLASNNKFFLSTQLTMFIPSTILLTLGMLIMNLLPDNLVSSIGTTMELSSIKIDSLSTMNSISPLFDLTSAKITSFVILYLLLTMIVVVKLTSKCSGPLRKS
uniref:NADH-ubiquinone oxidoreductase chain 6 n=1 Tax=Leptalpheus forceps TaxID=576216 RepID=A0A6B9PN23_9EUCA|nr:NADH dehydrogenase subunit 6 [Leptalpheus forceps]